MKRKEETNEYGEIYKTGDICKGITTRREHLTDFRGWRMSEASGREGIL